MLNLTGIFQKFRRLWPDQIFDARRQTLTIIHHGMGWTKHDRKGAEIDTGTVWVYDAVGSDKEKDFE